MSTFSSFAKIAVLCIALGGLSGCGTVKSWFTSPEEPKMEGNRLTILEYQDRLEPESRLQNVSFTLPEIRQNSSWPQVGGYPDHAMRHVALGSDLKRAFKSDIGAAGDRDRPAFMSPVVANGRVFTLDADLQVSAFDAQTGKRLWDIDLPAEKYMRESALGGGLAFSGGRLYVTAGLRLAFVMNPANGEILKKLNLPAPARAAPTVRDSQLYVQTLDNRISVFETANYTPVWTYDGFSEATSLLGSAGPAVNEDITVAAFSSGEIMALRNLNGQTLWSDNLASLRAAGVTASIADIRGGVVLDNELAIAISYSGRMAAIDTLTGQRLWQKQIGSLQMPWVAGEVMYLITSDQQLLALNRQDGGIFWVRPLPEAKDKDETAFWQGPVLAGGRLIAVSSTGQAVDVNPKTGEIVKEWPLKARPRTAPVVAGNTMYLITAKGDLVAYR